VPLTFAYGSNMNPRQMADRCPSARFVCVADLADHSLDFTRKSVRRNCGVADAVASPGGKVCGVVYEVSEGDLFELDASEGFRAERYTNSYWRRECIVVEVPAEGVSRTRHLQVWAYFAERQPDPPLPSHQHKELIVSGAKAWGLPQDYIAELERIETVG